MDPVQNILETHYGIINSECTRLDGESNISYLVRSGDKQWILKKYGNAETDIDFLETQNRILRALSKDKPDAFPNPVPNLRGKNITSVEEGRTGSCYKLLTFVKGTLWSQASAGPELAHSLGQFLARMDLVLQGLENGSLKSRHTPWDLKQFLTNETLIQYLRDPAQKKTVSYFFMMYKNHVLPALPGLRQSIIHSDGNDRNILVKEKEVAGLIDFDDMVHSHLINETAIALPYLMFGEKDPMSRAEQFINGYHRVLPYEEQEIDILYYLVAARMCTTLCRAAYALHTDPGNDYLQVSAPPAWDLLQHWITLNPWDVTNRFRTAASMAPKPADSISGDLDKRRKHISTALSVSYTKPIKMIGAVFQYMYGHDGLAYLDAQNNIPHVGHCHPEIVAAGSRQMTLLNTNTRYIYDELNNYAGNLLHTFPESLSKVFFVNSGSAATDLALRLAFTHTGHPNIMILEHGYHGNTRRGIDVSHYKFGGKGGQGQAGYILKAPIPDTYKGPYTVNDGTAGKQYAHAAKQFMDNASGGTAAFIAEPVVGCGGQVPLARGYLKKVYSYIRDQGGVCISDEVQVGFGRLGDWFWGFESQDAVPDIVILGKPMGNGHPMAAVVTTNEIATSFDNGMEFFSSFGGNPVSCAIGDAVLNVLGSENLQGNAKQVGTYMIELFMDLQKSQKFIGDVRGSGLFIGVELVKDTNTKTPYSELAGFIKNELRNRRILIGTDGPFDNVLKIKPPMCFSAGNAERLVAETGAILDLYKPQ